MTLSTSLVSAAKLIGINVSEACETGLREQAAKAQGALWLEESRAAIEAYNARIERDGPLLAAYRRF